MTPETHQLIADLNLCKFAPATAEKRFIRQISQLPVSHQLTERQLMFLGSVKSRYSKQLMRVRNVTAIEHDPDPPKCAQYKCGKDATHYGKGTSMRQYCADHDAK